MKTILKIKLLSILFALPLVANSQVTLSDTIEWNASSYIEKSQDSISSTLNCKFITYGNNRVEWIQFRSKPEEGISSKLFNFKITEVQGEWQDLQADGGITYLIAAKNGTGLLRIKKAGHYYTIHLELTSESQRKVSRDFEVINYQAR